MIRTEPITFDFETNRLIFYPEKIANPIIIAALNGVLPIQFKMACSSTKNSCELKSDFDEAIQKRLVSAGFKPFQIHLPSGIEKKDDFGFEIESIKIVFEIEKANWEKIFYDLFKAHIYLRSGADFFVLMLPLSWGHSGGTKPLFEIAKTRLQQSLEFGYGDIGLMEKIFLVGFNQLHNGQEFSKEVRNTLRQKSELYFKSGGAN